MKLKIWHKMIVGISIPSLIALLGGILTYGYINDVKNRQGIVQVADNLKEHVLEIRRNEKNFLHYKDSNHYKSLFSAVSEFSDSLDTATSGDVEEISTGRISLLHDYLDKYRKLTEELRNHFMKEKEIELKVKTEGEKLEKTVAFKNLAKELNTSFILRLRILEKNHMFLRDKESAIKLRKGLSQLRNVTPLCYECIPYTDSVRNLLDAYKTSNAKINSLQETGDDLEKVTREITSIQRQKISSFITFTQKLLLASLLLLCILGPLFVYKTASYISAPIKRLDEITKNISQGNLSLRAPLKEHDETHSLAKSFNTMLDNLQQTQQSLKESLELLNEKQAQLVESEKRASMGFLVAGVAHEINNPLNNISLRAEIMKQEAGKYSNEKLNGFIQDVINQSERAHKIVNNLLDFARARKSGGMEKQDIVSIVKDAFMLMDNQLKVSNIRLEKDVPDTACYINGNRSKIEQVLVSIITNAIQAMDDNGTLRVSVSPDQANKNVRIAVSDTGKGIPEDDLKNIFEPFFTTKSPGEGTGLGLAVSHTLIKEHNGEIRVESNIGEGTTFTIILPLWEE